MIDYLMTCITTKTTGHISIAPKIEGKEKLWDGKKIYTSTALIDIPLL